MKVRAMKNTVLKLTLLLLMLAPALAQSSDPDKPTPLVGGVLTGSNSGGLSDETTAYYSFDVDKGTLTLTLDVTPVNSSDAGGLVQWTLMDGKFQTLKYDNLSAQGSPGRQVKDIPVTIKRRIVMKVVAGGNVTYKLQLAGSALKS
jgi:hypothetical protein